MAPPCLPRIDLGEELQCRYRRFMDLEEGAWRVCVVSIYNLVQHAAQVRSTNRWIWGHRQSRSLYGSRPLYGSRSLYGSRVIGNLGQVTRYNRAEMGTDFLSNGVLQSYGQLYYHLCICLLLQCHYMCEYLYVISIAGFYLRTRSIHGMQNRSVCVKPASL